MEDIWRVIKKYPKTNIIIVSLLATILIINEALGFAEMSEIFYQSIIGG